MKKLIAALAVLGTVWVAGATPADAHPRGGPGFGFGHGYGGAPGCGPAVGYVPTSVFVPVRTYVPAHHHYGYPGLHDRGHFGPYGGFGAPRSSGLSIQFNTSRGHFGFFR